MNYLDVLEYLYHERPHGKVKLALGLSRVEKLLNMLGNPQNYFKSIHITGTNGKGSTARMIYRSLMELGERVGLFTSPHLYTFRERIEVNGRMISENDVVGIFNKIREPIARLDSMGFEWKPSFFEVVTAMAFEYFKTMGVDWAVVEVGLGGRLDATNVITPEVSVITNVDYDHVGILGNTLEKIAFEKGGIIKPNIPVVTGEIKKEPLDVIEKIAEDKNSDLSVMERDFFYCKPRLKLNSNKFTYRGNVRVEDIVLSLNGRHQFDNASVALRTLEILDKLDEKSVRESLERVTHPGRFEVFEFSGKTVVLDGAHNPSGMRKLAISLKDYFKDREKIAVMGILDDKNKGEMVSAVQKLFGKVYVTRPKGRRSEKFYELCDMFRFQRVPCEVIEKPWDAFRKAVSDPTDVVVVAGSLYLVGEIRMMIVEGEEIDEWRI